MPSELKLSAAIAQATFELQPKQLALYYYKSNCARGPYLKYVPHISAVPQRRAAYQRRLCGLEPGTVLLLLRAAAGLPAY
jgi:hypothetical protein